MLLEAFGGFWEAFGRQKMKTIFGVRFGIKVEGSSGRAVGPGLRIWQVSYKVQSTPCSLPSAGGGGS